MGEQRRICEEQKANTGVLERKTCNFCLQGFSELSPQGTPVTLHCLILGNPVPQPHCSLPHLSDSFLISQIRHHLLQEVFFNAYFLQKVYVSPLQYCSITMCLPFHPLNWVAEWSVSPGWKEKEHQPLLLQLKAFLGWTKIFQGSRCRNSHPINFSK